MLNRTEDVSVLVLSLSGEVQANPDVLVQLSRVYQEGHLAMLHPRTFLLYIAVHHGRSAA